MYRSTLSCSLVLWLAVGSTLGCIEGKKKSGGGQASQNSPAAAVEKPVGDTGIVEGTITMEGDPAPVQPGLADRVPKECSNALAAYNLLFREGTGRKVADVFVGVTGYSGAAAEKTTPVQVSARGCSWDRRTYGLTAKQFLQVKSADSLPYLPQLFGANAGASLVAVPGGGAVSVYPHKGAGMYLLVDQMRNFTQATVLVVKFSTFDVTGLDGKFRIEGVPVGSSKLSAYLPTVNLRTEQPITVSKNKTTQIDVKLRFDAAAFAQSAAATAAKGSASPGGSLQNPAVAASAALPVAPK